jgi:hypothetical protein
MAVTSSYNKFTVPSGLPSDAQNGNQGLLMPKLKFRFRALFQNFGARTDSSVVELSKQVMDIKRPSVNFNPITIDVYNSKVYLQGKPEWQETTVQLRDDAGGNVSRLIAEQVQKQFDFMEQSSAASGYDYKFTLVFDMLDGGNGKITPNVLESWELGGCFLSQVDYGDMNYATNEPATINLTIRFDNAIQISTSGNAIPETNLQTPRNPTSLTTGNCV